MNPPLYRFQERGIPIIRRRRNILLADQMGLGKSVQSIMAAGCLTPIVVVCPAGLRSNWANEFVKWGREPPHVVVPASSVKGQTRKAKSAKGVDFLWHKEHPEVRVRPHVDNIVSYGYAIAHQDTIACHRWELMIIDEAHELSNPASKRSRAIFGGNGIAKACVRIWALTGTPMRNTVADLWIWCRKFGVTQLDYRAWVNEYCEWYPQGRTREMRIVKSKPDKLKEVHQLLSKIMLRRTKKGVKLQLPELRISEYVIPVPPPREVPGFNPADHDKASLEAGLVEHALGKPNAYWGAEELALLQGLAQSVPTLQRYTGLQKVPGTVEFVRAALEEDKHLKALILFTHQSTGEAYAARLADYGARLIYGPTSDKRDDYIQEFQISNGCRVLIGQYKSIGVGHNITRADLVVAAEQPWDPATLAQGIDRAHRIGRTEMVDVRLMVLDDPLDRAIVRLLQRKMRDISVAVDGANIDEVVRLVTDQQEGTDFWLPDGLKEEPL